MQLSPGFFIVLVALYRHQCSSIIVNYSVKCSFHDWHLTRVYFFSLIIHAVASDHTERHVLNLRKHSHSKRAIQSRIYSRGQKKGYGLGWKERTFFSKRFGPGPAKDSIRWKKNKKKQRGRILFSFSQHFRCTSTVKAGRLAFSEVQHCLRLIIVLGCQEHLLNIS